MMIIIDPCAAKPKKLYELVDQVDELNPDGKPTGKKVQVRDCPMPLQVCQERETWLTNRLAELQTAGITTKVEVVRGSYDDVIGIETSE